MPVITISRGTFSGGKDLAECLAEKLGLECVSRELLTEAAQQYGVDADELNDALEKPPGFWDRMSWKRQVYLAHLRETLCQHAQSGKFVYHGHAGHFLLGGISHVLRVLVIADMDFRIDQAMQAKHLTRAAAESHIQTVDEQRRKWTRFLYNADWRDPFQFDLTVNLQKITIEDACQVVTRMTELPAFHSTPASRATLVDAEIAAAAEAALLEDKDTRLRKLQVDAVNGVVTVRGVGYSPQDVETVKAVLGRLDRVKGVRTELAFSGGIEQG